MPLSDARVKRGDGGPVGRHLSSNCVLISETKARTYDDLWLWEPQQFLHDALPRARKLPEPLRTAFSVEQNLPSVHDRCYNSTSAR
jgi:hypothetical protein